MEGRKARVHGMMPDLALLGAVALTGFVLGSIPFGLLLTRAAGLGDIRHIGSGNIGATNVLRTGRRGLAAATLLLDGAKGAAAVLLGLQLAGTIGASVAGLAAVLGHMFTPWLRFRGGKGVATGLGVLLAASPATGIAACAVWLGVAFTLRISSAAALSAFAAAPVLAAIFHAPLPVILMALVVAALVAARHEANIGRLLNGTEPRIGGK
jgi:acyl phosphate:glycerol-3-phosphate acyltransferase